MSSIKLLSEAVCNRIAAGEVVERPASVVKELVENSLDAGALRISIRIENAGQRLISVTDDGAGMDPDDALLCLETHATSKIESEEDIFHISSFGFRGEALPSIASVSALTIRTRRREAQEGVEVLVRGAKLVSSTPVGCAPGTAMTVRDLFFNVPARKKFLRSASTEERHIMDVVTNLALANPHASFDLAFNGRAVFSSPAADSLIPRIRELFGREYADALIPMSASSQNIKVTGFISRRNYTRPSRADQRIFINGRPIEAAAVYRAIREGIGPMIERGRYPVAFVFLSMDPALVDVNVHPTKKEVRFRNEFELISAVRSAVTAALRSADPVIPYDPEAIPTPEDVAASVVLPASVPVDSFTTASAPASTASVPPAPVFASAPGGLLSILQSAAVVYQVKAVPSARPGMPEPRNLFVDPEPESGPDVPFRLKSDDVRPASLGTQGLRILGLLEDSYIVAAIPDGLVLIDQHAAHERVLFEQILKGTDSSVSQKLLIPISLELPKADLAFVLANAPLFQKLGFEIEPFGDNTLKLSGIPAALPQNNAGGIFRDTVARVLEDGCGSRVETSIIARAACKAAVKAHDRLTIAEAEALLKEMSRCELPFSCPHGRPTVLNISLNEIERRFGRK